MHTSVCGIHWGAFISYLEIFSLSLKKLTKLKFVTAQLSQIHLLYRVQTTLTGKMGGGKLLFVAFLHL